MLRFGEPCIKDGAVRVAPLATRLIARIAHDRLFDRPAEDGRLSGSPQRCHGFAHHRCHARRCRAKLFVPENRRALAYLDLDLDVSEAGAPKRFLIKPAVLARMLQAAEIKQHRQRAGRRLRHRLFGRRGGETRRPGDRDRKRSSLAARPPTALAKLGCANVAVRNAAAADGEPPMHPMMSSCWTVQPRSFRTGFIGSSATAVAWSASSPPTSPPRAMIVTHSHADFGTPDAF